MYFREALTVLGLEGEDEDELTKDSVRRQYMRKLREHPPERDPEGFQRLREAFDAVKSYFPDRKERRPEPEPEVAPPSLVIDASQVPAPPTATEYGIGKGAREDVKARNSLGSSPPITDIADGEAEGPGSSGQYSFRGKRILDEDDSSSDDSDDDSDSDQDEHEHEYEHEYDRESDGQYSLRGPSSNDEAPASSGQYSFRRDESDDDESDDDESDDDEDEDLDDDDDDEYERPQSQADVAFDAAEPTMSLEDLVEKILLLLQHEEVEAALEVQANWHDDADADDHRRTNHYVAIRWALTRELLVVARLLPVAVVGILAKGVAANDLSTVKAELEAYRRLAPDKASEANGVLAKLASDLHKQLGGALYVPPPKRDYFTNVPQFTVPDVRSSSGSGAGNAVWVVLGVIVLFVRIMASSSSSSHSSSSYDQYDFDRYKVPDIDYDALSRLSESSKRYLDSDYGRDSRLVPPEPDVFDPKADRDTQQSQLDVSISVMFYPDVATDEQRERMGEFEVARQTESCAEMRDVFAKVEELPASTRRYGAAGDKHIRAIRERLDVVCPDTKRPQKKKPAKNVRKKTAAKPPVDTAETP